jgi:pimeloyl-ACP methyl ester carboxylesterase
MTADASRRPLHRLGPNRARRVIPLVAVLLGGLAAVSVPQVASAEGSAAYAPKPTVVLVHGAFADASGWNDVSQALQHKGYPVLAPANPERGLISDSAYLSSILSTIDGPIVLVGHSYGGMVLTNAANGHPNVKALVYIAAFAPDLGDTVGALAFRNPGSGLTPDNLVIRPYPVGLDGYIKPSVFHAVFAADLSDETAAIMAASQRPADLVILAEPSGPPAWRTIPSWYMVATNDKTIPPATERFMAKRAGATTVEVASSHVAIISHPAAVESLIIQAADSAR